MEEQLQEVKGTECEVYSRVVGFFSNTKQWNNGKQEEFKDRETYNLPEHIGEINNDGSER